MLVSDIVRRVRDAAGDLAVLQFSQTTLTDWINDGIRECVIENSLLQSRATSATVIGQTDYTLPADIFKLHSVYADGYKMEVMTLEEWEQSNTGVHGGTPESGSQQFQCYVYAGVLTLWPSPTTVVPLVVNYTKLPTAITYTSGPDTWVPASPAIPEAFHNHVVAYCMAQVALQDDDLNKYTLFMGQFKSGVIDLKSVRETDDLYPSISLSVRDSGDGTYG